MTIFSSLFLFSTCGVCLFCCPKNFENFRNKAKICFGLFIFVDKRVKNISATLELFSLEFFSESCLECPKTHSNFLIDSNSDDWSVFLEYSPACVLKQVQLFCVFYCTKFTPEQKSVLTLTI